ncbi:MlaD family protein [Corallincola platygyrae]|uniref:MlaD family protein n=1 Tax=Corallincola platygyrae TaxID=1193278 RepID=A0ABW4XMA4_9GAMM
MSDVEKGHGSEPQEDIAEAIVEHRKGISMVWLLPLLALAIGGWLVYKSFTEAKLPIDIEFSTGEGIIEGKTEVRYKGFTIGVVDKLVLKPSLDGVVATVLFEREAREAIVDDTLFWLVKPEVSLAGVSGLDTLLSGNYIAISPGSETKIKNKFVALEDPPPMSEETPGLHLTLYSDALDSISEGSPVLYRQLTVGSVTDYTLTADGHRVQVQIHILPEFEHLVKKDTRFWNISGIDISGGLDGFHVDVGSVATIVAGGIAFSEPVNSYMTELAEDGDSFRLHKNFSEAETGIEVQIYFSNASGILPGKTKIKFKGYELGTVEDVEFDKNMRGAMITAHLDPKAEVAMFEKTQFWLVRPKLSVGAVQDLDALISGPYISIAPSSEGEKTTDFVARSEAPPMSWDVPGLHLVISADSIGALERGAPIYYKRLLAGSVQNIELQPDGKKVDVTVHIRRKFAHLVNDKTRFWHAGGIDVEGNLRGIKVRTYSVVAMLAGGLAFDTPLTKDEPKPVKNGHTYLLYQDYRHAHADRIDNVIDKSAPGLYLVLDTPEPGGLQLGAPVSYLNLDVGEVIGLELNENDDGVRVHLRIEPRFSHLVKEGSHFWRSGGIQVEGGLDGIEVKTPSLISMILGGVSFDTPSEFMQTPLAKNDANYPLFDSWELAHEKGLEVTVYFENGDGVKAGTELKHEGIVIGRVKSVALDESLRGVNVTLLIDQFAEKIAVEGTQFWIVRPELGLVRTANLDTLLKGVYLRVVPGNGAETTEFVGVNLPPQNRHNLTGLKLVVETPRLNSIKRGNPVLFREIQVGRVVGYELADSADHVRVFVNIEPRFAPLVRDNSIFYSASGLQVDAGIFSGVKIRTESLETLIAGGIAFVTPDEPGKQASNGDSYVLRAEADEAWLKWAPKIPLAN